MSKRFLLAVATLVVIGLGAAVAMFLAKGYTFSAREARIVGTGIISVTSVPDGASVYIDGHLATATNTNISQLKPKSYHLKIVKEGFIPWEINVEVAEGLVTEVKATLFPALPTIYPLTFNGVVNTLLSHDGQKLAFAVPMSAETRTRQKGGVWVWTMTSQPISFNRGAEPHQLVSSTPTLDFTKAALRFSPDSKTLLVTLQEGGVPGESATRNFLLPADRSTSVSDLKDITPMVAATLKEWEDDQKTQNSERVLAIKDPKIAQVASSSAVVRWSPDETKFIAGSGEEKVKLKGFKVYDLITSVKTDDKNRSSGLSAGQVPLGYKEYTLPEAYAYYWLPDSRHVILVSDGNIAIADFDGTNVAVIYAGPFQDSAVYPWPDSSRLMVVTSFNTPTALTPNLFGINLK